MDALQRVVGRRAILKYGAAGIAATDLALFQKLAWTPQRDVLALGSAPDIQFDIGAFIAPARDVNGIPFRFGPVFTLFTPARLARTPGRADQGVLASALDTIEDVYPFSPSGVFTFVSYGLPYFARLAGGLDGALVRRYMPFRRSDPNRFALEEAVPGPTDVSPRNPGIKKMTFNVPVVIEDNEVLFTVRSDRTDILSDVLNWLAGSGELGGRRTPSPDFDGLLRFQTARLMFQQRGLPRQVADSARLPFAGRVHDDSPMWMGFADQHVDGSGPPAICTFAGNDSAHLTNKVAGNYFDNGAVQHLSHVILDLGQWLATPRQNPPDGEPFTERVQYMFRSNQRGTADGLPNDGFADQFSHGGGPAFLANVFQGTGDASANARAIETFQGKHRMGHLAALQRSSRAADGTPIHLRMDGPGFDRMDVPDGSRQPKLQFTVFVPTSDFFQRLRANQASLDLAQQFAVADDDNGIERFLTTTRRQNFLVPPRRHRAFPLVEFT